MFRIADFHIAGIPIHILVIAVITTAVGRVMPIAVSVGLLGTRTHAALLGFIATSTLTARLLDGHAAKLIGLSILGTTDFKAIAVDPIIALKVLVAGRDIVCLIVLRSRAPAPAAVTDGD